MVMVEGYGEYSIKGETGDKITFSFENINLNVAVKENVEIINVVLYKKKVSKAQDKNG
jgi:hypothetical protein